MARLLAIFAVSVAVLMLHPQKAEEAVEANRSARFAHNKALVVVEVRRMTKVILEGSVNDSTPAAFNLQSVAEEVRRVRERNAKLQAGD